MVIEELARASYLGIGFSIHSDMVAPYVDAFGTEAQKARWLPAMTRGELIGALALTEPGAGSDLKAIRSRAGARRRPLRAQRPEDLHHQRRERRPGHRAGQHRARPGRARLSLFCVEAGLPGYAKGAPLDKIGQHSQDTCELFFDDLRLPADCLLGQRNAAFEYLTRELARERLAIALRAAASLEGMLEETAEYIRGRKVFGRRVIDYQNSRFILANARAQSVMLRVFLDDCLAQLMAGELDATTAAIAKLNATEIQGKALDELLQLYGGYGYMAEYGIGRAWSDARALRLFGGTSEIMREIIGRGFA